ncbi:hypothetical protein F970_02400 [Acinetobacter sp. CIP 102082]|jgi:hypothetical protein|nr:hypothetical protein F974_00684 [Acinetobacter sp. CIP 102159]ENU90473.1 hypothetical protein F972_00207 [Acinetobacter sp. CIP 102529]ENU94931.1 hypothetical protein F970_02400 [Acinetobacter sp. CIP 102082]ENV05026.1 hypothetical protein F967_02560 [Acinetobacter sp. CIP 102637]ENX66521.1 hypothetical protein F884_00897 [Acinetobacter sp. CIP 102143]MCU4393875.1 hypothetical protein [Acinetobacter parvus]
MWKSLFKIFFILILALLLSFIFFIGFYLYMIYGVHPSDEGKTSISCIWENGELTAERITIIQGKRVMTQAQAEDCADLTHSMK